jgi:hypothetical protein
VVQLIHADAKQCFDMFPLMIAASFEQAGIAHECFEAAQVVNHWMFW